MFLFCKVCVTDKNLSRSNGDLVPMCGIRIKSTCVLFIIFFLGTCLLGYSLSLSFANCISSMCICWEQGWNEDWVYYVWEHEDDELIEAYFNLNSNQVGTMIFLGGFIVYLQSWQSKIHIRWRLLNIKTCKTKENMCTRICLTTFK